MQIKMNKIVFSPSDRQKAMLLDLMDEFGLKTVTSAVEFCIIRGYESALPAYLREKRLNNKVNELDKGIVTEKDKEKEGKNVCHMLGGKTLDQNGQKVCQFYTYDNADRHEMTVPLVSLNEGFLMSQYLPNKAKVERLQRTGKTNYGSK